MIEIKELTKSYNGLLAVEKISLNISANTIFGFVGANGAGKSTTINILTGIILPTSGEINILGYSLMKNPFEIKRCIGVVPEILALFDGLTGKEYLEFVGKIYSVGKNNLIVRINELLDYFELYPFKNNLIETYSQGMRKKLAFSSAIVHAPKVLFLDEPFENVDPVMRKKMKEILIRMKNNGAAILITSHSLIEIEDFCDKVAIINKGKIVYQSDTKDIRNKIKNEVTKETYQSLEEIFIDLTVDKDKEEKAELSWLTDNS